MAEDRTAGPMLLAVAVAAGFLAATYWSAAGRKPPAQLVPPGRPPVARIGQPAASPMQSLARGWWPILKRTFVRFNDDRLMTEAAGVTFYTLLAIFPALATLISLFGLVADPAIITSQLQDAKGIIPDGGLDIIKDQVTSLTAHGSQTLGFGVLIGVLASLWSANAGVKSLFDALNVVYHEREKRGYVWRTLVCLCFTLGGLGFLIVALAAIVAVPIVFAYVGLGDAVHTLVTVLRWPLMMIVLALFLALIYRYGPSRRHAEWQWVSGGSLFASIFWVVGSLGFSYYVSNFGSYNKTYGSLGAVIGFMTWIWISTMVVLLGGELNAELEQLGSAGPPGDGAQDTAA
jgi:membrane protein